VAERGGIVDCSGGNMRESEFERGRSRSGGTGSAGLLEPEVKWLRQRGKSTKFEGR